jgi:CBS domain-containing protein
MTPQITFHDDPYIARPTYHSATVGDVMHVGVLSCRPETPIIQVAATMAEHHVHAVVVDGVRRDARGMRHVVWGVVSDLDLVGRLDASDVRTATAGEMSATPAIVVGPEESLPEATRLMRDYDVHHLLVVDGAERRPVGVISTLDVIAAIAAESL